MSQIKQLLNLHHRGTSIKAMTKILGISRNTVKAYLAKVSALGLDINRLLEMDDMELHALFHSGNPSYKGEPRYDQLMAKMEYYQTELKRTGVTRHLLWHEYIGANPEGYQYSQFCYHLSQWLQAASPSMVLTHLPGEKLFIDFAGSKLAYTDHQTGELITCEVFVATLPASDYCFAMAVPSQKTEDFLHALQCCLVALGGVPATIVCDNLKSAVIRANRYEPELNQALEDFANHYRAVILPARSLHPKDKALVENQVQNVYRRVYAPLRNAQFFSLGDLNAAIAGQVHRHNQTRMQLKSFCREEYFLAEEKQKLRPLPEVGFELKYYAEYKVAKNNHILLTEDKHYYSVPYTLIGERVKVIYTRSQVRIYAKSEQVAVHMRNRKPGAYSTNRNHLCSTHRFYLDRSPEFYMTQAEKVSEPFGDYIRGMFNQSRIPEQLYRQCDGLLSLARKTDQRLLDTICTKAGQAGVYSYRFILNCIANGRVIQPDPPPLPLPSHPNIRGKNQYH